MKTKLILLLLIAALTHLCRGAWAEDSINLSAWDRVSQWRFSKNTLIEFFVNWREQASHDPLISENERDQRLQFLDRMTFQVDRKFDNQELRQFFVQITWEMALTDEMSENRVWSKQSQFLRNLSTSLKEVLEPSENILGFIRSYVEYSTVSQAKSLDDFANSRSYTNGHEFERAELMDANQAAEIAFDESPEAFLNEVGTQRSFLQFRQDLRDDFKPNKEEAEYQNLPSTGSNLRPSVL